MPTKLKDSLEKVRKLDNRSNSELLLEFYDYLLPKKIKNKFYRSQLHVMLEALRARILVGFDNIFQDTAL